MYLKKFVEDFNRYNKRELKIEEECDDYLVKDEKTGEVLKLSKKLNTELDDNRYFKFTSIEDDYEYPNINEGDFDFAKHKGFYRKAKGEFFTSVKLTDLVEQELPYKFEVANQQFEISEPSSLFLLFFGNYRENKCEFLTIKVKNTNKKLYKKHIETALFYLSHSLKNLASYPKIESFVPAGQNRQYGTMREDIDIERIDWDSEYIESLSILNKGKTYKDLLAYYRFIEYFFVVNRKDDILSAIKEYTEANKVDNKAEHELFERVADSSKNEEKTLNELLSNLDKDIIVTLFKDLGLSKETSGIKEENINFDHIVKTIYSFRNENVHAKKYSRRKIQFCNSFLKDNHDAWVSMFDTISFMIIQKFLYKK